MKNKYLALLLRTFVFILVTVGVTSTQVSANDDTFKSYGDFSKYTKTHPGPNEVYGYYDNIVRKMDVYGNIIWEYKSTEGNFVTSTLQDEHLLVATDNGYVLQLHTNTGEIVNAFNTGIKNIWHTMLDDDQALYISTSFKVIAYKSPTEKLWESGSRTDTGNTISFISDDYVITNTGYWIDKNNGKFTKQQFGTVKFIDSIHNVVYITNYKTVLAIRLTDGDELWRKAFNLPVTHVIADENGHIYVAYHDATNYVWNYASKINVTTKAIEYQKDFTSRPSQLLINKDNQLIVNLGNKLTTYSDSGTPILTQSSYGNIISLREDGSMYTLSGLYYSTIPPSSPTAVTVKTIIPSATTLTASIGDTNDIKLTATYSDDSVKDVTATATWTSSDKSVATVEKGKIKAVAAGKATITAQVNKQTITIAVTIKSKDTTPIAPPTVALEFSDTYDFSALVSDTTAFNKVLSQYTTDELQVIVPAKHFYKVTTTHVPNVLTSLAIETSRDVRKIDVHADETSYTARRISTTSFDASVAGLAQGTELIIIGYDATGKEIAKQVLRLRNGETITEDQKAAAFSGQYSLKALMIDTKLFNNILNAFSLEELTIGVPKRYILNPYDDIQVAYNALSTKFTIKTTGKIGKVVIVTATGESYEAKNNGNGIFTRDITGLAYDELVTIQVINSNGDVVQQETAFVE